MYRSPMQPYFPTAKINSSSLYLDGRVERTPTVDTDGQDAYAVYLDLEEAA